MAKKYKGSLSLEWYNKQKSILVRSQDDIKMDSDIPAPKINWINKEDALFYEINDEEGKGLTPYWVDRNDIRVKEARPLLLQKTYKAIQKDVDGTLPNTAKKWIIEEGTEEDPSIDNILIKGDNLLALNTLKKMFDNKEEEDKIKCIYIDPPYNTGSAFEYYEDNLAHSEWLTLMRDRLVMLKSLMRQDGHVFVQIDNKEVFRLKLLMDEVFGEENFVNDIIWKRRGGSANPLNRLNNVVDYILWYKISDSSEMFPIYTKEDENTKKYIKERFTNIDENGRYFMKSPIQSPNPRPNLMYDYKGYKSPKKGWSISKELMEKWDKEGKLYFPENKEQNINRKIYLDEYVGQPVSSLWTDIKVINPMSKERNEFDGGQKPESIMQRVFQLTCNEGDVILDCFGGSGSTFSTAQKMNLRWIGTELGSHIDSLIIPRLKKVIEGTDDAGISKSVNWQGGGSFKYYHLGESIITLNQDGTGDFNWKLGRKYIEEAFLSSYDYIKDENLKLSTEYIFPQGHAPIVGIQEVGTKIRVAIISLNAPDENNNFMAYDEIFHIYQQVKRHYNPQYINVFTNRGVEIAYESKPDDLEVIKVPKAIFSELEK
ncbi:MAG: site-specific DNA-methyltransferase [Winogradskyella sp.]